MFPKRFYSSVDRRDNELFPYNRVRYYETPKTKSRTTRPMNTCPYIQDNVYKHWDGVDYIRDESDYELMNCIIHPETLEREPNLTMTPKRLAADPGKVIVNWMGRYDNQSDFNVRYNTMKHLSKQKIIYRSNRYMRPIVNREIY